MKDRLEVSEELAAQGFRSEEQARRKLNPFGCIPRRLRRKFRP